MTLVRSARDPRHLMRFMRFQALSGSDSERFAAIAKSEGVSMQTVKDSVRQIEIYRKSNDRSQVDLSINESILKIMPAFQQSMAGLLAAEELVEVVDHNTGKKKNIKQEDKTTRLEASRIVKDVIIGMQPKAPIAEVNVSQTNQVANLSTAETYEERMDRLRQKIAEANALPAEVAAVPRHLDRDEDDEEDDGEDEDENEDEE